MERAERGIETAKRTPPKAALGLTLVGIGIAVAVVIRRSRMGKAAAQAEVLEQPEEPVPRRPCAMWPATRGLDVGDLADAADAVESESE